MSVTIFQTTSTHKSSHIVLSGGGLTYTIDTHFGDYFASASSLSSATKFQFEHLINAMATELTVGLYDGTTDLTNAAVPGWDTVEGCAFSISATGIVSCHVNKSLAGTGTGITFAVGDVVTVVVDTTIATNNVKVYRVRGGTSSLSFTTSYTPASGEWWPYMGGKGTNPDNFGGGTVNFAGPFSRPLDSGFSPYDDGSIRLTTSPTRKSTHLVLSSNALAALSDATGDFGVSSDTKTAATKFQFEVTLGFTGSGINFFGIDNGTFSMTSGVPAIYGEGVGCKSYSTATEFNQDGSFLGTNGGVPNASGDVYTFVVDTTVTTNNIKVYQKGTLRKTFSWTSSTGEWWAWVGSRGLGSAILANFSGPFTRTLDSGYSAYDSPTTPISSTGEIKVWNGSSFIAKPIKVWNGTSWVTKPLKYWNGTSWVVTSY